MDVGVSVAIRIRPFNQRELRHGETASSVQVQNHSLITRTTPSNQFHFDHVLDQNATTRDVYDAIAKDVVDSSLKGINGTIFAYGQTSTGKTHTMFGSRDEPGVLPLAVKHIFNSISMEKSREFLLRVGYMEIYNEIIKDLLKPGNDNLKIHQNLNGETFVGDLTEIVVSSIEDVEKLINLGDGNRHIGETNMNEKSSRSHTIFRMVIESRDVSTKGSITLSLLNLVDLAGSERVGHTGAEGIRLKEGGHINKSLLALGTVIAKLSEDRDNFHIPYRDSKLTRILQSSLGGNARTGIVCTITPAVQHVDETISTLRFANRAKNITNRPHVNEILSEEAMIKLYKKEIDQLKQRLSENESRRESKKEGEFESYQPQKKDLLKIIAGLLSEDKSDGSHVIPPELTEIADCISALKNKSATALERLHEYQEYFLFAELEIDSFRRVGDKRGRDSRIESPRKRKKSEFSSQTDSETLLISTALAADAIFSATNDIVRELFISRRELIDDSQSFDNAEMEKEKHDKEVEKMHIHIAELEDSLTNSFSELNQLKAQKEDECSQLNNQLMESLKQVASGNHKIERLSRVIEEQNEQIKSLLEDSDRTVTNSLSGQKEKHDKEVEKMHIHIAELEDSLTNSFSELNQLKAQKEDECSQLISLNNQLMKSLQEVKEKNAIFEDTVTNLNCAITELHNKETQLKAQNAEQIRIAADYKLQSELREENLKESSKLKFAECLKLKQSVEEIAEVLRTRERYIKSLELRIHSYLENDQNMNSKIEELENCKLSQSSLISSLQRELQIADDSKSTEKMILQEELSKLETMNRSLQENLSKSLETEKNLFLESQSYQRAFLTMSSILQSFSSKFKSVAIKLLRIENSLPYDLLIKSKSLCNAYQASEENVRLLHEKLDHADVELQLARLSVNELRRELDLKLEQLDKLQEEKISAEFQLREAEVRAIEMVASLQDLEQLRQREMVNFSKIEANTKLLAEDLQNARVQFSQSEALVKNLEEVKEDLTKMVEELESKLDNSSLNYVELETKFKLLENRYRQQELDIPNAEEFSDRAKTIIKELQQEILNLNRKITVLNSPDQGYILLILENQNTSRKPKFIAPTFTENVKKNSISPVIRQKVNRLKSQPKNEEVGNCNQQ